MKKTLLLTFALALSSFGAEWTGYISDAACGASNANDSQASKDCAKRCVKSGSAPVFVVDGKVITIADPKKVMDFVGEKVKVSGKLEKNTLTVEKIAKAS